LHQSVALDNPCAKNYQLNHQTIKHELMLAQASTELQAGNKTATLMN
jgi:hypothetical protein